MTKQKLTLSVLIICLGSLLISASAQVPLLSNPEKMKLDSVITVLYNTQTGSWEPYKKVDWKYDESGRMMRSTIDLFNMDFQKWDKSRRMEYHWDESGRLVKTQTFKKVPEFIDLIPHMYEDLIYDDQGKLVQVLAFERDGLGYSRADRDDYTYDQFGRLSRMTDFSREGETGWVPNYVQDYETDSLDRLGQMTFSEIVDGWLITRGRTVFEYGGNGDIAECNHHIYTNEAFLPVARQVYTHDTLVPKTDLTIPFLYPFEEYLFSHQITQIDSLEYIASNQVFVQRSRDLLYYSGGGSGTNPRPVDFGIRVYPNPVPDLLYLEGSPEAWPAEFSIFNQNGQLLLRETIRANGAVSLFHLQPGYYFFLIRSSKKQQWGSLIKQ